VYGESSVGVTGVSLLGHRVIVARLDGSIHFLQLETFQTSAATTPLSPSSLNKKIKGMILSNKYFYNLDSYVIYFEKHSNLHYESFKSRKENNSTKGC